MGRARKCQGPGCTNSLAGRSPLAVTCSRSCQEKRARAIKRRNKRTAERPRVPDGFKAEDVGDVAREIAREELRPVVREAITEDVLSAVGRLVQLTPTALAKLEEDLGARDPAIRQKAYTLLLRYTLGNPSVAPPPAEQAPAPMQVVFNMPRPDAPDTIPEIVDAETLDENARTCVECGATRNAEQFVGNSERCQECHDALQARIAERFH